MKKRKSLALILYIVILVVTLSWMLGLFSGPKDDLTHSQVIGLLEDGKVKEFVLEEDTLHLLLHEEVDGKTKLTVALGDPERFSQQAVAIMEAQGEECKVESHDFIAKKGLSPYDFILPIILAGLGLLLLWVLLIGRPGSRNPMEDFGKARAVHGLGSGKRVTFQDVAGLDEEKEELQEVVDFLKNPEKFTKIGAKIPHGILLSGPPGTGKTLLAKAVAGEAEVRFLSLSGSDFMEMYVGVGASRVRDLFQQAKRVAPAIIFIDEIDAVGRKRGAGLGGGHDEREQTLNQLLVEMDGFGKTEGVIVLAATNRPDILDPALLRPGRFDRQVYIGRPDTKGREAILKVHAKGKCLDDSVNLHTVALATSGFTGADLANLMNEAAILAARENRPALNMKDLNEAIMKVLAGPEKKSRTRLEKDRRLTAYHEAGHAVAMYHLPTHDPVHQISIIPRGQALGLTWSMPQADSDHITRNEMYEQIVGLLGGRVAEALFLQDISTGASNDIDRASKLARDMVARFGMNDSLGAVSYIGGGEVFIGRDYEKTKSYSEKVAGTIDDEVKHLIDKAYEHCTRILKENSDKMEQVVNFLLENDTMSGKQFQDCMAGNEIRQAGETSLFENFTEE